MLSFLIQNLRWIAAGFLLCFFSGFGQTYFVSLSNDHLRAALNLSHSELGAAYAFATLASAFLISALGGFVDRWKAQHAAFVPLVGLAAGCGLMAFSEHHFVIMLAGFFAVRFFGQGLCGHVALTATGKWFNANRGKAVSLVSMGYPLSQGLHPGLGALGIAAFGLMGMWGASAVIMLIIATPFVGVLLSADRNASKTVVGGNGGSNDEPNVRHWRRRDVVRCPEFYLLNVSILCAPFINTAFFFHQQHLARAENWPIELLVGSMVLFAGIQVFSKLITGVMIDKWNARSLLPYYLLPQVISLIMPYYFDGVWTVPVILLLLGLSTGIGATMMGVLWPELFGTKYLGEIRALSFAIMVASTAIAPVMTGYLIDIDVGFQLQLLFMGLFCLLASLVMFLIQPTLSGLNARLASQTN